MPKRWKNRHGKEKVYASKSWPDGTRYRRRQPSWDAARKLETRIDMAIALGTWRTLRDELTGKDKDANPTIREFSQIYLDEYCAVHNRRPDFKQWAVKPIVAILGQVKVKDVKKSHAYEFISSRAKEVQPPTVNRGIAVLKNMLSFAVDKGIIEFNPLFGFNSLPEPETVLRVMTLEEERSLIEYVYREDPVIGAFAAILGETAMRLGEGLRLEWPEIDMQRGMLTVAESKAGKCRHIPLTPYAMTWLRTLPRIVGKPKVFLRGQQAWKDPRGPFQRGAEAAGLSWVGFHDLRHFRASQWVMKGIDLRTVQGLLGHASITTTMRYAHFAPSHAQSEVLRVGQIEESAPSAANTRNGRPMDA